MKKLFNKIVEKVKKPFMSIDNPDELDNLLILIAVILVLAVIYVTYQLGGPWGR